MVELIKPSCQAKNRRIEAVFHLNNTVNVSLNFKKKMHIVRIFMKDTPILALKIIERGVGKIIERGVGVYLRPPCYGYAKLPFSLFGNTSDMSFINEKAKFVCFIHIQPQKVKCISVQINMNTSRIENKNIKQVNAKTACIV